MKNLVINQLEEVRRQSKRVWAALPEDRYLWQPDPEAMHMLEVIRHVLKSDAWFHFIIKNKGDINSYEVFDDARPFTNIQAEFDFHEKMRADFLDHINAYSEEEFATIEIFRTDKKGSEWPRKLDLYLLRVAYHETVHTGQFLSYLRMMGVDRPWIWNDE